MKNILIIILAFYTTGTYAQNNFQKYFDSLSLKGSTTIYDYNNKKWIFTDEKDANIATLPASTFKIPNTLFALEFNAVKDENEIFKWDGKPKKHLGKVIPIWNQDTDLKNAFKNSTIWVYVEVAKRVGRERYIEVLKKIGYGNNNLSERGADFWNFGEFAVTPKNQVEFLIKLYENQLPFSQETIDKTKEIIISKKTGSRLYRSKTGWTMRNGKDLGWWIGYVTTSDNVYFFATRLLKDKNDTNPNFAEGRKIITNKILNEIIEIE